MSQPVEVSHALSLASPELSQKEKEQTNWPMAWLKDKPQLNYIHSYLPRLTSYCWQHNNAKSLM